MFDMNKIGKRIKTARTEHNMTQMDLADVMGISYQAVSNWERGNSMPDISKLPELCELLNLNLEELMGNADTVNTVKKMISNENADISLNELADVAPIVPPQKMEQVINNNSESEADAHIDMDSLLALAPFLDDDKLAEIAKYVAFVDLEQLVAIAPFLEEETLDYLVDKYLSTSNCKISDLVALCPFLSTETVNRLAEYAISQKKFDTLVQIAPFM